MIDQLRPVDITRDRIIEAARELFFERGYNATGISQILSRSETNSGSLYHFFPTKEDVLVAVLEKYKDLLLPAVIDPAKQRASEPIDRIFAVLHGYRLLLEATNFNLGCPIGNLGLEVSNSHPRTRILIQENFQGWIREVAEMVRQAAGYLPPETDPNRVATLILCTMEGAVMLARTYRSFQPFDDAVVTLRDLLDSLVKSGSEWSAPTQ